MITEATEVGFPENACTSTFDCIFSPVGFTSRRLGFDYEAGFVFTPLQTQQATEAVTEFIWNSVAGDGGTSFLVQQVGATIFFSNLSTSVSLSGNPLPFTVNLNNFIPVGSSRDPSVFPCQYASGRGVLVIVNRVTQPIYVIYSATSNTITATGYELQTRDFTGVPDGLLVNQRPTVTTTTLKTQNPPHYYNLLNQGWSEVSRAALSAWDTARSGSQHDSPSNADFIALYRSSPTAIFDNNRVLAQDPLTSPAAKGHYILNAANPNRNAAMQADGFFDVSLTNPSILISQSSGTAFSLAASYIGNFALAFDGVKAVTQNSNAWISSAIQNGSFGKNYVGNPKQISQCIVYGTTTNGYSFNSTVGGEPTITWTLMASQIQPVSATSGVTLGSITIVNQFDESGGQVIQSNDTSTFWNYVWVVSSGGGIAFLITELEFYAPGPSTGFTIPNTTERPKTVCFFAGRLFYAGLDALSLNNTIFFTQILTQESQYGQCYQVNDPTNETVFELLPSDGGTIVIPEASSIRKLFAYQNALLILASNGVWMVTGGSSGGFGGGFTANDFFVKKLSSIGMNAPLSVTDRRGVPTWWGEDGIYTVNYNAQFNSFEITNTTFKTIRSFFLNVPHINHQYVKGTYDPVFDVVYWIYNTTANPSIPYTYTNVLLFNGIMQAFYPWTISNTLPTDPQVRGLIAVRDAAGNNLTHVKFFTSLLNGAQEQFVYSEQSNPSYQDWSTASLNYNYNSFLTTNYKLDTQGQRYVQMSYVWVYLENIANSSLFVQGLYDFASSGNSGKWSTPQQAYDSDANHAANHTVDVKRLKLRGKGRSIQLLMTSDTNKPFQVQGWAIHDTMTLGV